MNTNRFLATISVGALAISAAPAFAGDVNGIVTDANDTVALQSAVIRIPELRRTATTARDGSFRIGDLPAGTYTIEARYVGAELVRQTVEVPESGNVTVNFALSSLAGGDILVIGQAANQANALSRKYASDTVSDVLSRDAIGQFPDQNVAESLRRLPGINVLNDQGEGRFVSVRGLDPSLNATSINGVRIPSPEGDTRAVALDVVSNGVIESIEVKKSLTPDMDADTIGASIEINTVSAFDRRTNLFTVRAEGSYNEYADKLRPRLGADFAYKVSDDFGISGGIAYYNRFFETDNIEADDWEEDNGLVYAEEVQYRDYDVERERISASLGFDARVSDTTEIYLRGLYSRFDDQEFRRRLTFDLGDAAVSGSGTSAQFTDEIVVESDVKDRFERQEIKSVSFGGETQTGPWFLEYQVSWAQSSELEDGSVDPTQFEQEFDDLTVDFNYANARTPLFSVSGAGAANFANPELYGLKDVEFTDLSDAQDEEFTVKFDAGHEFAMDSGVLTIQTGFKGRWRDKMFNKDVLFFELDGLTLADVQGIGPTYRITDISPLPGLTEASDFFFANRGDFELQEIDSQFDSAVEDYLIEEDILAGYALARWDSDSLTVIGGVRYEHTQTDIFGNFTQLVEENGTLPDDSTAGENTVIVSDTFTPRNYGLWLPSLNVRFEPVDNVVFRGAGYRSLVRPGFAQIAPRFATEQNDGVEGEFGNPNLLPYKAWNLDASAEYYFSGNGAISLAFFYKDVRDYIVDVEYEADGEQLVFNGIAFDEAVIPLNGDSAEVWGIEFGFAKQWSELPAPFDGLLTQANYTYTDATGTVPGDTVEGVLGTTGPTRTISLPSTSEHTFNGVLGYEKGPFSVRLAGTFRDDYLDELNGSPEEDRFVDSHFQLDASIKYRVTPKVQVFAEAVNLTDAEFFAYNNVGGQQNNYQYEIYGRTFKGGVKVTF